MGLLLFALCELLAKLLLEALHTASRIDELLLAGKEWMATGAYFNAEGISGSGRTGLELGAAARAVNRYGMITGM